MGFACKSKQKGKAMQPALRFSSAFIGLFIPSIAEEGASACTKRVLFVECPYPAGSRQNKKRRRSMNKRRASWLYGWGYVHGHNSQDDGKCPHYSISIGWYAGRKASGRGSARMRKVIVDSPVEV